jgi:[ribosomal protein S5]-alanine N-acetyltransferase
VSIMAESPLTAPARFETPRLVLRRPRGEDEAALIALDSEPDVLDYLVTRGADAKDMVGRVRARIGAAEAEPAATYGWWVIEGKEDGVFHGRGLLAPMWDGGDVEVGIYLRRASRCKGFATEAATALLDYAFFDLGLPRIIGVLVRRESPAKKLLARLRLTHKGKVILYGHEADRYVITSNGWLPRRR